MNVIKGVVTLGIKKRPFLLKIMTVSVFDFISKILSVILFVFLIRILSKGDYAQFTFFNSVTFLIFGVISLGINSSFVRFESERVSRNQDEKSKLYFLYLLFILVIYAALFLIAFALLAYDSVGALFGVNTYRLIFWGILYSFPLTVQNLNESYYQTRENFTKAGILFCLKNAVALLCILATVLFIEYELIHIILLYVVISFVIAAINCIMILKEKVCFKIDLYEVKYNISTSLWLIIYCFFVSLIGQMDIFMVSAFLSQDALANYGVATKYFALLLTMLPSIMTVVRVRTSKADIVDNMVKQKQFTIDWIKRTTPLVVMIITAVCILASIFFPMLNGAQYKESVLTFQILSVCVVVSYICAPNVSVLMSKRKDKVLCILGLASCVFNLIASYVFIPAYGINAAAVITVISHSLINISATIIVLISKDDTRIHGKV